MKKALIIYHRVDFDGLFGQSIAEKAITSTPEWTVDKIGLNYGDPEIQDIIPERVMSEYSAVFIIDFCLPAEIMIRLREIDRSKVYWIDHHITQIKESESAGYSDLPGIRVIGKAAAELTWGMFFPDTKLPLSVDLVSAYDVWDKTRFDWDTETLSFQYGLRMFAPISVDWNIVPGDPWFESKVTEITSTGRTILQNLKLDWEKWIKTSGIPVTVGEKEIPGMCLIGGPHYGSSPFESVLDEYDIYVTVNPKTGSVSMYSEPDRNPEFSCGDYMKENYSGGGHRCAAGGKMTREQLLRLLDSGKV